MENRKILLATNGSQGVATLRELYALGFDNSNISIITFQSKFNQVFIEFLKFNKKEFTVVENSKQLEDYFMDKSFDILLSLSFRFIFSERALNKIQIAAINFHPGILPFYKGSFSIPWAIINNEEYVGYTYHHMIKRVDCGQIIKQEKFRISNQTAHTLNYLIFQRGISKLGEVLKLIKTEQKEEAPYDEKGVFYNNKLPFNGEINPDWDENKKERFIRAMYFPPFESAFLNDSGQKRFFNTYCEYQLFIKNKK